jgi:hypothetical protein
MKNLFYTLILLFCTQQYVSAQLAAPGDIAFVGMNADGGDGIAFLALVDIAPNTTIYFSDNEWQGSAFNTNESYFQWTHTACVPAGTVIIIQNINQGTLNGASPNPTANTGTVTWSTTTAPNNNSGIANSDECVYAYLGTSHTAPTVFLAAIASDAGYGGVLTGTGLTTGSTFIEFNNDDDVFAYTGTNTCEATQSATLTKIANTANWISQDGSGDQSNDGTAPDFPADIITSFTGCYTIGCAFPIQLTQFKGIHQNNTNYIEWHFENPDLIKSMQLSVFIEEKGFVTLYHSKNNFQNKYAHYTDSTGTYLYRLSWQDKNGATYYSSVIEITAFSDMQTVLYPNPAAHKVWVNTLPQGKIYEIYTAHGQQISQGIYSADGIDLNTLPKGLYFVRFIKDNRLHVLPLIKAE